VETKIFLSALIRGEECIIEQRQNVTLLTLRYIVALSHNALGLWRKVVASKSSCSGLKGAVIATYSYHW
jgi:hypothetical protein